MDDFDLHSRSQLYENLKTLTIIFLKKKKSINFDDMSYAATTCWFVEAYAKIILHYGYPEKRTLLM